jgi:hypothetical protein
LGRGGEGLGGAGVGTWRRLRTRSVESWRSVGTPFADSWNRVTDSGVSVAQLHDSVRRQRWARGGEGLRGEGDGQAVR